VALNQGGQGVSRRSFGRKVQAIRKLLSPWSWKDWADLARRFGCSQARVTQKLNLLNLPRDLLQEIEAMGDNWERRLVTEPGLRNHMSVASRPENLSHL
jgi:hypothetical protein